MAEGIRAYEVNGGSPGCFYPRHALRWKTDGGEAILVICFECSGGHLKDAAGALGFLTKKTPQTLFGNVFLEAGMTKAKQLEKDRIEAEVRRNEAHRNRKPAVKSSP